MICDEYLTNMFWKYNSTSSPAFDAVLQKEDITLQELMDQEDVIQECKLQNKKLVEFLCQRNVLEELVTLITEEPSEELDEKVRFKYPNIACELLTCDVPALNESLSRDNELLEKLYSFIEKEPPLNPLLASFLSRTLGVLIVKRLDQWISYQLTCLQAMGFLKEKENFINQLLKHLGTSAIMDLTLKLITEVGDVENRQNLLNWLDSQNLVQSLVALFDPKIDSDRHYNAAQLICDVLRISRDALIDQRDRMDSDPVLSRIESSETVSLLLDHILGEEKSETSIVCGIQVLLALLGSKNNYSDTNLTLNNYDETEVERKHNVAESTALVILQRLKDFKQLLLDPPKRLAVKTTIGCLDPPLGNIRLQIVKLMSALFSINNSEVLREIINLGIMEVLLDLFFKYVWNNFLHAQVEQCIAAAFKSHCKQENSDENAMYSYLITKCRLMGRILEAWDDNEQKQTKPKGVRQGYMGHLINIANNIVNEYEKNSSLDEFIKENVSKDTLQAWEIFIKGPLADANKTQHIILGGCHPSNMTGDDSNDDYNTQATMYQQQMYNDYQLQQLAPSDIIENYNFHDNDFNDTDHPLNSSRDRCANINLNLNEGDMTRQAEIFKKVCSEYINTFDDADDNIFDEQILGSNTNKPIENWDPRDNSSDEEDTEKKTTDPWFSSEESKNQISISDTQNPWSNADASNINTSEDAGWADFANFSTEFPSQSTSTEKFEDDNCSGEPATEKKSSPEKSDSGNITKKDENETNECASNETSNKSSETVDVDTSQSQSCTNEVVNTENSSNDTPTETV